MTAQLQEEIERVDKYADIRAALDAATPGPWKSEERGVGEFLVYRDSQEGDQPAIVFVDDDIRYAPGNMEQQGKDVTYIAACHPEAIRALLAERDALREALEMMVEMVEMNGFGRDYAMDVARAALAQEES